MKILALISEVEVIAVGTAIRELARLKRVHGPGRWRKCKAIGRVVLADGATVVAEIHWSEAHGIGAREHKIKRLLDDAP